MIANLLQTSKGANYTTNFHIYNVQSRDKSESICRQTLQKCWQRCSKKEDELSVSPSLPCAFNLFTLSFGQQELERRQTDAPELEVVTRGKQPTSDGCASYISTEELVWTKKNVYSFFLLICNSSKAGNSSGSGK